VTSLGSYLVTALCCTLSLRPLVVSAEPDPGYRLKAAFVLNFLKMMTLPGAYAPDAPLRVCVAGAPALDEFSKALEGLRVGAHELHVVAPSGSCDVLFVSDGEHLPAVRGAVATIDEAGDQCANRSDIQFFLQEESSVSESITNRSAVEERS
jgi:hypothetical protein